MRVRVLAVWIAVAMIGTAVPVFADSITVLGVTRTVSVQASAGQSSSSGGGVNRDLLDVTRMVSSGDDFVNVLAGLDTTGALGTNFDAFGTTQIIHSSEAAEVGGTAVSTYAVRFLVNESVRFIFGATFAAFGGDSSWLGVLRSDAGDVFRYEGSGSLGPLANGVLAPGSYEFVARAQSSVSPATGKGTTRAAFDLGLGFDAVSPTPEPGSLLLLGTGAVGLIARRRRQRSS